MKDEKSEDKKERRTISVQEAIYEIGTVRFKDFEECAVLFFKGFGFSHVEKEGTTCWFHFFNYDPEAFEDTIHAFRNGMIEGNIRDFCDAMNRVRKMFKSY